MDKIQNIIGSSSTNFISTNENYDPFSFDSLIKKWPKDKSIQSRIITESFIIFFFLQKNNEMFFYYLLKIV